MLLLLLKITLTTPFLMSVSLATLQSGSFSFLIQQVRMKNVPVQTTLSTCTYYDIFSTVSGKAGGACTSALLQVLYRDGHTAGSMSWVTVLRKMRVELNNMGFRQVPQLTSSRMIDVNQTMHIVPPGRNGRRRAVLIGINYVGQQGTSCQK